MTRPGASRRFCGKTPSKSGSQGHGRMARYTNDLTAVQKRLLPEVNAGQIPVALHDQAQAMVTLRALGFQLPELIRFGSG